jgi:cobalt/nickel transport system permease protein
LVGCSRSPGRILGASVLSVGAALQLGAFSVVLETFLSGKSELPFGAFALLMQPIHLAIGCVEGFVTAGVINYVRSARPEILESIAAAKPMDRRVSVRNLTITFIVLAVIAGGALSRFASTLPDGLEWSITKITGIGGPAAGQGGTPVLESVQGEAASARPEEKAGTSAAGAIGAVVCLGLIVLIGMGIRSFRRKSRA